MKILFFGDSITDMCRNRDENADEIFTYGSGYPMLVASALYRKNPLKYQVINRGIGGDRVADLNARVRCDVWRQNPDVLTVLVGINNVWDEFNDQDGQELERFRKIYSMMIEDTLKRFPNLKIILGEPFVLKGKNTEAQFERVQQLCNKYAEIVQELAEQYHIYFLPLQDKFNRAAQQFGAEKFLFDGMHPMVAGATLIADSWLELFEKSILSGMESFS